LKRIIIFLLFLAVLIVGAIYRLAADFNEPTADEVDKNTVTDGTVIILDSTADSFSTTTENAGADITNRFPDENFRSAIREALSLSENAPINSGDVADLKSLSLEDKGIKDLTGIEYFLSLEKLDISDNMLTFLPRLPDTITEFVCTGNPDLDLSSVYYQNGKPVQNTEARIQNTD
jgi:Leucine-rich repeat (LRR) protein